MTAIDVRCTGRPDGGWTCHVALSAHGRTISTHDVAVAARDLERLAPGAGDPEDLVRRSFAFMLERESPGSILRSFELPVIGRYFPEYEGDIRRGRRAG